MLACIRAVPKVRSECPDDIYTLAPGVAAAFSMLMGPGKRFNSYLDALGLATEGQVREAILALKEKKP